MGGKAVETRHGTSKVYRTRARGATNKKPTSIIFQIRLKKICNVIRAVVKRTRLLPGAHVATFDSFCPSTDGDVWRVCYYIVYYNIVTLYCKNTKNDA